MLPAAYGLRFDGLGDTTLIQPATDDAWPAVRIERQPDGGTDRAPFVGNDAASIGLVGGGRVDLDRIAYRAEFRTPDPIDDDELVHPYLAPVGMMFAYWLGRECFHCGAFVHGSGVWGLLGDKESGKSTTLAWLALRGFPVVSDDLLVVEAGRGVAGPRCIDLRASSADALASHGRVVRAGDRNRIELPPIDAAIALRGWIFLGWDGSTSVDVVPPSERIERLAAHRAVMLPPRKPVELLDAAGLPAYDFRRPRLWDALEGSTDRLFDALL